MKHFLKQQKCTIEIQNQANIFCIEAQIKLGELLKEMPKNEGTKNQLAGKDVSGTTKMEVPEKTQKPTYADLNIKYKDASKWQDMAENKEIISKKIEECTEQKKPIKENEIVREIKKEQKKEEINNIANTPPKKPDGLYEVIVIDPPWPMEKVERECRPNQVQSLDYSVVPKWYRRKIYQNLPMVGKGIIGGTKMVPPIETKKPTYIVSGLKHLLYRLEIRYK